MKSLADRHADRSQRIVDNATESTAGNVRGVIGHAATAIIAANEAVGKLTEDEQAELKTALEGRGFDGFKSAGEAEADVSLAGIGVVNPLTASAGMQRTLADTPAQNGERPEASFDPAQGNLNGQAIEAAGGAGNGWGAPSSDGPKPVSASMKVADIEAIAEAEGVDLSSASNNQDCVDLIEKARAEA